ncbi:GNAT domain-containing protein [Rhexocercosporidium sp. MPI-PUGE-AT-0058]|nr:GNAT domain-containing protein [Rhexocercosporidium sp. MPI-PUGE-AT-0058]
MSEQAQVSELAGTTAAVKKPRIYLEPLDPEKHMEGFHELWTDEETLVWFNSPFPVKTSISESREFLLKILPNEENPDIEKFAMMLIPEEGRAERGEGEMVGFVGTNRYKEQGMEVGYVINRRFWGRGFATEGMRLFLDMYWAMDERKYITRLVGKTSPNNIASQNILLKCGARRGEVLKDVLKLFVDGGKTSDLVCWYLDRPGFERGEGSREVEREERRGFLVRREGRERQGEGEKMYLA